MKRSCFTFLILLFTTTAYSEDWTNDVVFPRIADLLMKDKDNNVVGRFAYDGKVTKDLGETVEIVQSDAVGKRERKGIVAKKDSIRSKKAVEHFTNLLKNNPNDAFPLLQRARAYEVNGKQNLALADVAQAVKFTKKANLLISNGLAAHNNKDYKKAIELYTQALQADRGNALCYSNRGFSYKEKGDPDQAVADFSEAIWLKPQTAKYWLQRGMTLHDQKKNKLALDDYTECIKRDARNANAYFNRGIIHTRLDDDKAAIKDYNEALSLDPEYHKVYRFRAQAWYQLGNLERAAADYEVALKHEPDNEVALENICVVLLRMQQYEKIGPYLKRIMQLQPGNAKHHIRMGMCYRDNGGISKAISSFDNALRLDPKSAWAYHERGMLKLDLFKWQDAIDDQNKAIEYLPKYGDAYATRALAYAAQGKWDDAFKDLETALTVDKECVLALNIKATLLAAENSPKKNIEQAIDTVELAVKLKGKNDPDVASARAAIHAARQEWDKAQQVQDQVNTFAKSRMMKIYRARAALYRDQKPLLLPEKSN